MLFISLQYGNKIMPFAIKFCPCPYCFKCNCGDPSCPNRDKDNCQCDNQESRLWVRKRCPKRKGQLFFKDLEPYTEYRACSRRGTFQRFVFQGVDEYNPRQFRVLVIDSDGHTHEDTWYLADLGLIPYEGGLWNTANWITK